jgi:hypothetical protein
MLPSSSTAIMTGQLLGGKHVRSYNHSLLTLSTCSCEIDATGEMEKTFGLVVHLD